MQARIHPETTILYFLQDLEEQKRTKYKINGTATITAIEKSIPNRPAKSRLPYSYQEYNIFYYKIFALTP